MSHIYRNVLALLLVLTLVNVVASYTVLRSVRTLAHDLSTAVSVIKPARMPVQGAYHSPVDSAHYTI